MRVTSGEIEAGGRDLLTLSQRELDQVRGQEVGMIWQDPLAALDPVIRVGPQIAEVVRAHEKGSASAATARATEMMRLVELPESLYHAYPHQLSGGQRQRVVNAAALAADLFTIVEQDMYPCAPQIPLPIATRTRAYYLSRGLGRR